MNHSEETKAKIRAAWVERRKTFVPPMKGKFMSEESRNKMSDSAKKRGSNRTGKSHSLESRKKISEGTRKNALRGPACKSFKDGKVAERRGLRFSEDYKRWRYDVFLRDGFTCLDCGDSKGGNLHAHHIKPFAEFPELRLEISNGATLCEDCHEKRHRK